MHDYRERTNVINTGVTKIPIDLDETYFWLLVSYQLGKIFLKSIGSTSVVKVLIII